MYFGGKNVYKWKTLSHNGVMFPKPYEPHNIPVIYKGSKVQLEGLGQEYATIYAKYTDTEYVKNKVFKNNFWKDWKKMLGKNHVIQDLDNCDFGKIYNHLLEKKKKKQMMTKEEKNDEKVKRDKISEKYKYALVDGVKQPVGNFRVEPPGIFIGRGCHPKLGKIKLRVKPNQITLNIGKGEKVPIVDNGKWKKIVHDRKSEWLATWKDNVTGKNKYVWLAANSTMRGKSDMEKFDLARKLKKKIGKIRNINEQNLASSNKKIKQIATAMYFIDNFALRVGNEKGADAADTVGTTGLRVEHIDLLGDNKIKLDFLGKDSIRYVSKLKVSEQVYKNLELFMSNKDGKEDLFDLVKSNDVNKYLTSFMKGLTAKVFRTFNASYKFMKELRNITKKYEKYEKGDREIAILNEFNVANTKIAALCNHQKKVSKSFDKTMKKLRERLRELKIKLDKNNDKKKIKNKIIQLKTKISMKKDQKNLSLGTSKINYIDPRIIVAFVKHNKLKIDKYFTKTLQAKFNWAMDVAHDFVF